MFLCTAESCMRAHWCFICSSLKSIVDFIDQRFAISRRPTQHSDRAKLTAIEEKMTLLIITAILNAVVTGMECGNTESDLYIKLLRNYNIDVRPVMKQNAAVDVQVDLGLTQIIKMDEKNQFLVWNGWLRQYWRDPHLTWNISEYQGAQLLVFEKEEIWTPDLAVYNNAREGFQQIDAEAGEKIIVDNNGHCLWMTPFIFRTSCKLDVTYFPFDDQHCQLEIGSWAYTGDQLNISYRREEASVAASYSENSAWHVLGITARLKIGYYACCVEPYPSVIYTMHLRRRSRFYIMNIIMPSYLISILAIVSFSLPDSSGERVTLLITTLLSLIFFLIILSNLMPPTSEVTPLLEACLTAVFIETALALIARSFIDKARRQRRKAGMFVARVINTYLATLLRTRNSNCTSDTLRRVDQLASIGCDKLDDQLEMDPVEGQAGLTEGGKIESFINENRLASHLEFHNGTSEGILSSVQAISSSYEEQLQLRTAKQILDTFLFKLDEFFFWLFAVSICFTLAVIFVVAPHVTVYGHV